MIKRIFLFVFLLLNLNTYAAFITEEGYGDFLIGKTSLQTVSEKYTEIKTGIVDLNDSIQIISFNFIDKGIELFFMSKRNDTPEKILLFQIDITAPCLAVTKNNMNVSIGIGSKEAVLKKHGKNISGKEESHEENLYFFGSFWVHTSKGKVDRICITSDALDNY